MRLALEGNRGLVSVPKRVVAIGLKLSPGTPVLTLAVADKADCRENENEGQETANDAGNGGPWQAVPLVRGFDKRQGVNDGDRIRGEDGVV
jgi:hypothetical protein